MSLFNNGNKADDTVSKLYSLLKAKEASKASYLQRVLNSPMHSPALGSGSLHHHAISPPGLGRFPVLGLDLSSRTSKMHADAMLLSRGGAAAMQRVPPYPLTTSAKAILGMASPGALPSIPTDSPTAKNGLDIIVAAQKHLESGSSASSPNAEKKNDASQKEIVRKDKVEEALRSKPQRGRKREDLTDVERLELTRTRNREHAKSTRMRKKARYQELLESEAKLSEIQQAEELDNARRESVLAFFSTRESAIRKICSEPVAEKSAEQVEKDEAEKDAMAEITENMDDISFNYQMLPSIDVAPSTKKLQAFDQMVADRLRCGCGSAESEKIKFKLKNGDPVNSIALSKTGTAFTKVDLVQSASEETEILLLSAIVNFQFADESSKIRSVEMFTLKCPTKSTGSKNSQCGSLCCQQAHPSVVSLDKADGVKDNAGEEEEVVGMNI